MKQQRNFSTPKMASALLALAAAIAAAPCFANPGRDEQRTTAYWQQQGQAALEQALAAQVNTRKAKNIILFVGDGNGITSVTATRIFDGQSKGLAGEDNQLSYEKFPHVALAKTYNTNQQTPDSAGTMTAIITGVKSSAGVISVKPELEVANCKEMNDIGLVTLLEEARLKGLATGIVSTTRITHATPAATYAHSAHRDWESDVDIPAEMRDCAVDIASQLIDNGTINVALGGGRSYFMPATSADPEYPGKSGRRQDGRDLIAEWTAANPDGRYIWNQSQFDAIAKDFSGNILGLFEPSHMHYEADRQTLEADEPSLSEMTAKAVARLKQNERGFFLMVEGGRIDHGHHAGNAYRALTDGQEFARAVQVAVDSTDSQDTLIIVTADHSHTLSMAGYPVRGNPILGTVVGNDDHGHAKKTPELAADGKPYTTLGYINGVGHGHVTTQDERYQQAPKAGRFLEAGEQTGGSDFHQEALVPMMMETHGGEDVAIYASGPWSHLFGGVHEQNYIYHVMKHALWPQGDDKSP